MVAVNEVAASKNAVTAAETKQAREPLYGKTVGEPKLSEKAQKYYEELKKKFGQYDFVLVSSSEKENAKANAAKFANQLKTVVLIDEEKIEKMATDASFRKKYEGILSGAEARIEQLKSSLAATGANVQGFGIQINDDGTTTLFAVLEKSSADQKARIEKHAEERRAERKAEEKKANRKKQKEWLEKASQKRKTEQKEQTVLTANSAEELIKKIEEYQYNDKSNQVQTKEEKLVGQHIDFRG